MDSITEKSVRADLLRKCGAFSRAREIMAAGLYPYFIPIETACSSTVEIDGRPLVMVGSNNYLGLTEHPDVIRAAIDALRRYGSGCTGSRFLNGTLDLHVQLEDRMARFLRREDALIFSTGFQANLGVLSALLGKEDVAVIDRESHASIIDGCRLSHGRTFKFRHNDMADAERILQGLDPAAGVLLVTEGVFSMGGDLGDLPSLVDLKRRYNCRLLVDDAHGIGVLGENGRGAAEHFGLEAEIDIVVGTFSKSLASIGGYVVGGADLIHFLRHNARPLIFSASMPPPAVATVLAALDVIEREPDRRRRLRRITRKLSEGLASLGYDTGATQSAVVPVLLHAEVEEVFAFWKALYDLGVFANPVVPPAVAPGEGRIRISCMATHTDEEIDKVISVFAEVRRRGIVPEGRRS